MLLLIQKLYSERKTAELFFYRHALSDPTMPSASEPEPLTAIMPKALRQKSKATFLLPFT